MLELDHISKNFSGIAALNDVSFSISQGVCGFLGPNGAGKSTAMNIMTGCLSASSGRVLICGLNLLDQPRAAKRCLGFLPELPPLFPAQTPLEFLRYSAQLKRVPRADIPGLVRQAVELTGLGPVQHRLVRNLSKGYRQRLGIAQAILTMPEVIILDEPLSGLDPIQMAEIRELIRQLGKEHTVLISSHLLAEIESICDNLLILFQGQLIAQGSARDLSARLSSQASLRVRIRGDGLSIPGLLAPLEHSSLIRFESEPNHAVALELRYQDVSADQAAEEISLLLGKSNVPILSLTQGSENLESLFLSLAEEQAGKGGRHERDL